MQEGATLEVRYADRSFQVPVRFLLPPSRQAGERRIYVVEKGAVRITQIVNSNHCANQWKVEVRFDTGFFTINLDVLKSNFNDGHYYNLSNFWLYVDTDSFQVGAIANSPEQAQQIAQQICENYTKKPPKPTSVAVSLHGDGPPFKRGKPVTVRAVVTGEGDMSALPVIASFSNGDPSILLRGGGTFEGIWVPKNIPTGSQGDEQGSLTFPVTVTATAIGPTQSATGSATTQVKIAGINITIIKPQPEEGFRIDWTPGSETTVMISGKVTDDEGTGIPARVEVEYWFKKFGGDLLSIRSEDKDTSPQGAFAFIFTTNFPGELLVEIFATAKDDARLKASKLVEGIIQAKLQLQVSKDGYRFFRGTKDGQKLTEQPINITAEEDVKEIEVQVFGLQPTDDAPPRLAWKPLKGATVQIVNGGSKTTNDNGQVVFPVGDTGRTVKVSIDMVPEMEVKIVRYPKAIFARPDAEGKLLVFLGKKVVLRTNPETGLPEPAPESEGLVTERRFKVTVRAGDGTTDGDIARPDNGAFGPFAHTITYRPPQALPEGNRMKHVQVFAEDITEGTDEPLPYKGELVFVVFKDAGLTFSKLTAKGEPVVKEPEPVPIDLVEGEGGVKVLPGIIEGRVQVFEEPLAGRPINGVQVVIATPEGEMEATTNGSVGPEAGKFRLELDPQRPEWTLTNPVLMPFVDVVAGLHMKVNALQRDLGYRIPAYRDQDGFENFKYRWDLRYETDKEKLQRILDAVKRLDAAVQVIPEAHPQMKVYMKESVYAVIDLVLFALFDVLKVSDIIVDNLKIGKGIGKSSYLRQFIGSKLAPYYSDTNALQHTLDQIEAHAARFGGLTDEAIEAVKGDVQLLTGNAQLADDVGRELRLHRANIKAAVETLAYSLKGDIVEWTKSALSRLGARWGVEIDMSFWVDQVVDAVLGQIVKALLSGQDLVTTIFDATDWIADQIAERMLAAPLPVQPQPEGLMRAWLSWGAMNSKAIQPRSFRRYKSTKRPPLTSALSMKPAPAL